MNKNCPSLQKSLAWCEGTPSLPGIRRRVFFCNKNLIVAWPKLQRDALGRPTSAVLQGNFELKADAAWQYLEINIDKSTVKSDPQGERPSQTQLNKGTFLHNGVGPEATSAASWLNNSDNVYVYEDMLGRMRVLGNNKYATTSKVTQDQGQGTNPASTLIEVEVTDEIAAPFYNGTLETVDGEVSPETIAIDENDDTEPYVNTSRITMSVGEEEYIDFGPKDGKWTFESELPKTIEVDANGKISAINETRYDVNINCKHDGVTVATVAVSAAYSAGGGENNNEGEVAPSNLIFGLFPEEVTLPGGGKLDLHSEEGITAEVTGANIAYIYEDEETGKLFLMADFVADQTTVSLTKDGVTQVMKVMVLNWSASRGLELVPGQEESFLFLIPKGGWSSKVIPEGLVDVQDVTETQDTATKFNITPGDSGYTQGMIEFEHSATGQKVPIKVIITQEAVGG